jgi:hypothetical protein
VAKQDAKNTRNVPEMQAVRLERAGCVEKGATVTREEVYGCGALAILVFVAVMNLLTGGGL